MARVLFVCLFFILFNRIYSVPVSDEDETPDFDCPNENEYYEKCQLAVCYKDCNDLVKHPPCPSIAAGCKDPKCVCKQDYLRDSNGVCVPVDQCPITDKE